MLERFDLDVGTGRREGQAYLTLEPDVDNKKTIIDFSLNCLLLVLTICVLRSAYELANIVNIDFGRLILDADSFFS